MLATLARAVGRTSFGRSAVEEQADLAALKDKPAGRVWWGLGLMAASYAVSLPALALCAWLSLHLRQPLVAVIGVPAVLVEKWG